MPDLIRSNRVTISVRQAGLSINATGLESRSTRSSAGRPASRKRNASRAWRLIALRNTAVCACFLGTTRPSRATDRSLMRQCKEKSPPRRACRAVKTAENSAGFSSRCCRLKPKSPGDPVSLKQEIRRRDDDVPWRDGHAERHGHHEYGNERGNHGCACGARRTADKYAS